MGFKSTNGRSFATIYHIPWPFQKKPEHSELPKISHQFSASSLTVCHLMGIVCTDTVTNFTGIWTSTTPKPRNNGEGASDGLKWQRTTFACGRQIGKTEVTTTILQRHVEMSEARDGFIPTTNYNKAACFAFRFGDTTPSTFFSSRQRINTGCDLD